MSDTIQRKRGSTAQHAAYAGPSGEITVDTSKHTVIVHDGTTAAGHPLAREDLGNVPQSAAHSKIGLSTDGTLAGNSDSAIPSQKAAKTYADAREVAAKAYADSQVATRLPTSALSTDGEFTAMSDSLIPSQKAVALYVAGHGGSGQAGADPNALVNAVRGLGAVSPWCWLKNGMADAFNDQSAASSSIGYDPVMKSFSNEGDPQRANVKFMLHMNGSLSDTGPAPTDWVADGASFSSATKKFGSHSLDLSTGKPYLAQATWYAMRPMTGEDFTVDCWLYRSRSTYVDEILLSQESYNSWSFGFTLWAGYFSGAKLSASLPGGDLTHQTDATLGQWHHVALVRKNGVLRLALDGVWSTASFAYNGEMGTGNYPLYVGRSWAGGAWAYMQGYVDELCYTKSARWDPDAGNFTPPGLERADMGGGAGSITSSAFASVQVPARIKPLVFWKNVDGNAVLNTDLVLKLSRDNGTTWTSAVLSDAGLYEGTVRMAEANTNLSAQPSGNSIKYTIDLGTKAAQIHAVGLIWE